MKIKDLMTTDVKTVGASDTVETAVTLMAAETVGALPVMDDGRLAGMLTDRDITSRLVAQQRDATATPVSAVMSDAMHVCYEDDDAGDVSRRMAELHVLRLPVVNRDKQLVGIVSAGDLTTKAGESGSNTVQNDDNQLDEALDETFPASDPISPP
jgi:CBS domain-containing protein